jgi:hypothetical protein
LFGWPTVVLGVAPTIRPIVNTSSFGGRISGFTFPQLGGTKVQVSADVAFGDSQQVSPAVLVLDGQKLLHVVNSSSSIRGYPSARITGIGQTSISHSKEGAVAFVATVSLADNSSSDFVLLASPDLFNDELVPVMRQGSEAVGGATYVSFSGATVAVAPAGDKVFVTFTAATGTTAPVSTQVLLVEIDVTTREPRDPVALVKTGEEIPGSGGLPFLCISNPSVSEKGEVTFFGSHCGNSSTSRTSSAAANRKMYRTRTEASHCLHLGSNRVWPGIFSVSRATGPKVIASAGTQAPVATQGTYFTAFSSPSMGADGTVAFVAETGTSLGIYAMSPGQSLRLVASTNTKAASGLVFQDFPEPPSVGDMRVAFYAAFSGAGSGVYLEDQDATKPPLTLLTMADKAMGAGIVFIGFGQHSYDEVHAEVAMYLVLDDALQTDGIYAVKVADGQAESSVLTMQKTQVATVV